MTASLDMLLNELLEHTRRLQSRLLEDAEPEEWNDLLDQRQNVIQQLNERFEAGATLSDEQKRIYLQPAAEADMNLIPVMNRKKQLLAVEMANFRKSKAANDQYGGYGGSTSAYGAFFDKRK